jgi:uncharacterized membrane protein YoaK (UPF0700 family)
MFVDIISQPHYSPKKFALWNSLAFQAGCVNVGGLLACHRFVTHTTGFATHFGVEMATGNFQLALGIISVPLFFLVGNCISAFFTDRRSIRQKKPNYTILFSLMVACYGLVTMMGVNNGFGVFGTELTMADDYFLLGLLSFSSGVQNAMITSISHSVIRTTHLTGLTTDLGIGLVRIFSHEHNHPLREQELKATGMRVGIIVSFIFGSWMGASLYLKYQYYGFLVPFTISTIYLLLCLHKKPVNSKPT